jgi:predicted transcriptional regulator
VHAATAAARRAATVRIAATLLFIVFSASLFSAAPAFAQAANMTQVGPGGYIVTLSDNITSQQLANSSDSTESVSIVQFWQLPLWIQLSVFSSMSFALAFSCLLFVPLVIRRFRRGENDNKGLILAYIADNPGCTAPELSRDRHLNLGTVRYHIHRLHEEGHIVMSRVGKFTRIFVNRSTYGDREKLIASYLRNDTSRAIIGAVLESPGINNQKLSEKLGLEKSLVYRHMQKLLEDGVVMFEWEGKNKLYYISMEAKEPLFKLMPLHYQCPGLKRE